MKGIISLIIMLLIIKVCATALSKIALAEDNEQCMVEAIYFEARGEDFVGQLAVGTVIMERVESSKFPSTVCKVVRSGRYWKGNPVRNKCAFSYWCDGKSEKIKDYMAHDDAIQTALLVLQGVRLHQVQGSTYYHASYVRPSWARKMKRVGIVGRHIFYKEK